MPARTGLRLIAIGLWALLLAGCTTWRAPGTVDPASWRDRAVSETLQDVKVSAAVLSTEDSRRLFGVDVNASGIQPVWIEVENGADDMLWLLRAGTDPDYFSPLEVAWAFHTPLGGEHNRMIDDHFDRQAFENPIPPGSTRAGVIFTNPHRRTRLLNVDLLGRKRMLPYTLFLPVPDDPPDFKTLQIVQRYAKTSYADYQDEQTFRAALERLPCCTVAAGDGDMPGEPINAIVVGTFADTGAAMQRRGFRSDRRTLDDRQLLFGRPPDVVARKAGQASAPAHWLRAWVAPLRYRGKPVMLAQVGRPVGGRFVEDEKGMLQVHPDVDEVRNLFLQDMLYSGGLARFGFVAVADGVGDTTPQADALATRYPGDGLRVVMMFVPRPLALSDVELLDWEPYLEHRAAHAAGERRP
jgi:hypothetical protein